jgi:hypothetical protein
MKDIRPAKTSYQVCDAALRARSLLFVLVQDTESKIHHRNKKEKYNALQ